MKIALISPKGPLYRHRTGIFRKSLRMAPLTLTTLAALIPPELDIDVAIYDEGIEDLPEHLEADLIGMTVITGTAARAYELAKRFRDEGKTVVLGGPHVTLVPEDAQPHADAIVSGYAEETWPQLLRDFIARRLQPAMKWARTFPCTSRVIRRFQDANYCKKADTNPSTPLRRLAAVFINAISVWCPPPGADGLSKSR